jgi:hypothetical protein
VHGPPAEQIVIMHSKTSYSNMSNQTAPQGKAPLEKQLEWPRNSANLLPKVTSVTGLHKYVPPTWSTKVCMGVPHTFGMINAGFLILTYSKEN